MANNGNLKPFKAGDKRINRKGRPVTFAALRTLAQQISHEVAQGANSYTVAEAILRSWANSGNPALQMKFIEVAFGKVPNEVGGADGGPVQIRVNYGREPNTPVDLSTLTDEQLDRLQAGESLDQVRRLSGLTL